MSTNLHGEWSERQDDGFGQPIRQPTCLWCGSITPEAFVEYCKSGCEMSVADWKYGWPHKVYVKVPNPNPDELRGCSSTSAGSRIRYRPDGRTYYEKTQDTPPDSFTDWDDAHGWYSKSRYPTLHLKFYTEHLVDLPNLSDVAELVRQCTGVLFTVTDGKLRYRSSQRTVPSSAT